MKIQKSKRENQQCEAMTKGMNEHDELVIYKYDSREDKDNQKLSGLFFHN